MYILLLALHLFFIAMGVGIGFSNLVNLRASRGQTGDIAKGFGMARMALRMYSDIVIAGFLITGFALFWITGNTGSGPWFSLKMAFVLLLVVSYGIVRMTGGQIMRTGNMALMSRINMFAPLAFAGSAGALVCAVLAFN
jgi:uncharacterized membrane protein SirB2